MRPGGGYVAGVILVAAAAAGVTGAVPDEVRLEVGWGAAVALLLQAPLGWWALGSIGTERFFAVWTLGMIVRFAVVGIAGLALFPAIGGRAGPMLGSMVGVLLALLLVEGVTAFRDHSREDQR